MQQFFQLQLICDRRPGWFRGWLPRPLGILFIWFMFHVSWFYGSPFGEMFLLVPRFCRPQTFPLDDFFRLCNFHLDTHQCGISPKTFGYLVLFLSFKRQDGLYHFFVASEILHFMWWFPSFSCSDFCCLKKRRPALRRICSMWTLPMCMV